MDTDPDSCRAQLCRECHSPDVSPHCFSAHCSWVRCNVCGAVTGFVRRLGQLYPSSFPNSA
jgi:hypothetical protein